MARMTKYHCPTCDGQLGAMARRQSGRLPSGEPLYAGDDLVLFCRDGHEHNLLAVWDYEDKRPGPAYRWDDVAHCWRDWKGLETHA